MTEVASGAGTATRYADAIAMNLWPSRGLAIHGFEVKVSRGDWLRELKNPAKADVISAYCDYWWVVAPEGIVLAGELPHGWGLMVPNKGVKLRVVTKADNTAAKVVDRAFVAAMLRRAQDQAPDVLALQAAVMAERKAAYERQSAAIEGERERRERAEAIIGAVNQGAKVAGGSYDTLSVYMDLERARDVGRMATLAAVPIELARHTRSAAEVALRNAEGLAIKARAVLDSLEPRESSDEELASVEAG